MIECHGVTYRSKGPGRTILDGVSFTIPAGQWVSIVGANGSGKSTLLKLIDGLSLPSDGVLSMGGTILTRDSAYMIRRQAGIVFQNPENQFIGQTVLDDIVFGLENRALSREVMHERLQTYAGQLGVSELLYRHPSTLSGGQMQRAALAAVLAMEPEVLLLDEVTSMLDGEGRSEILDILRDLHATGRYTVVAVTHDIEEMLASDRLLALHDGTIVADGAPKVVLSDEALCRKLSIQLPFTRRLAIALEARGIDVRGSWEEKELMDALWR